MQTIQEFVAAFERASATADPAATGALFAPSFLSASPDGVRVLTPDDVMRAIPQRKAMMQKLASRPTSLVRVDAVPMDGYYTTVTTDWRWQFARPDSDDLEFTLTSTWIVHRAGDRMQIVFYRSGDLMTALRERGLLSS
jgi:hypothetical protein